jgi:hypothetical protein
MPYKLYHGYDISEVSRPSRPLFVWNAYAVILRSTNHEVQSLEYEADTFHDEYVL